MRTRSLLTALACTAVFVGAGAGTAFADSTTPTTSPTKPGSPPAPPTAVSSPKPSVSTTYPGGVPTPVPSRPTTPGAMPPPPTTAGDRQIPAVPSGAPNTGVVEATSDGHGEAAAVGASLAVLLGGSGTVVLRRRLKGRG